MKSRWRGTSTLNSITLGQRFGPDQNGCPVEVFCEWREEEGGREGGERERGRREGGGGGEERERER